MLFDRYKLEFPETFAPDIAELAYTGNFDIDDPLPGSSCSIGEALLSPTRTYAPILRQVFKRYRDYISAVFHNSGGGQTKCLNFGYNVQYVKDNLFAPPPIFQFIRKTTQLSLREMLRIFNMGHRLEIVCSPEISSEIIEMANNYGVQAQVIGRVRAHTGKNRLTVHLEGETIEFSPE